MRSLTTNFLGAMTLTVEQASTLNRLGEYRGKQELFSKQTPETLKSLQQVAVIESSESSNRIEGVTAPHDRIEALVLKSASPQDRSEQEIAGYRDALALIHESGQHMAFSVNVILQLHSMLLRYMPNEGGRWKATTNDIVERNPDGSIKRVRFKPLSPVATPPAMDALAAGYRDAVENLHKEPLVVIPLAILDFLCIHPFSDGNGRVARLLTLMLLYRFDYQVGRYISMERIFEDSKETYYETLEASSTGWHDARHDASPWMDYFWGVLLRAYREFEDRVATIGLGKGSKTEQVRQIVDRRMGPFSISDIEADCIGVSRDMIRIVLRQLRDEGVITPQGSGRGARWIRWEEKWLHQPAFYMDTNVISHLADPERTDRGVPRRLALLVRSGAIEVIGAAEIIEEFAGMARTNPRQFARSLELFWTLVGDKVLAGRNKLLQQEITKGSMLSRAEALLDADRIRQLQALPLDDVNGWDKIAKGVHGQGKDFASGMHVSAEEVQAVMLETVSAKEVRKNAGQLQVSEKVIKDWYEHFLRSTVDSHGLSDDDTRWPDVGQLPCMRAFVSIFIALAKKHHMARDHKYQVSDQHDVDHYTNAAIAGCLVTSDRPFRDTAGMITWRSFPVIDTQEFLARVKRM